MTSLRTEPYRAQHERWPTQGRHILAQYDDDTVVVYQAYRPSIGHAAAADGRFGGGGFSFGRMSWIKPNFLWMMFRSGWGTKPDQEVTLAVRLRRKGFDAILAEAVHSSHVPEVYGERAVWQEAVQGSNVRLQWDPDHAPGGTPVERRAVQLGLRGATLRRYAEEWTVSIEDVSDFVAAQREHRLSGDHDRLVTPREEVYPVRDAAVAARLGVAPWP
jgi:hypothetical protein